MGEEVGWHQVSMASHWQRIDLYSFHKGNTEPQRSHIRSLHCDIWPIRSRLEWCFSRPVEWNGQSSFHWLMIQFGSHSHTFLHTKIGMLDLLGTHSSRLYPTLGFERIGCTSHNSSKDASHNKGSLHSPNAAMLVFHLPSSCLLSVEPKPEHLNSAVHSSPMGQCSSEGLSIHCAWLIQSVWIAPWRAHDGSCIEQQLLVDLEGESGGSD